MIITLFFVHSDYLDCWFYIFKNVYRVFNTNSVDHTTSALLSWAGLVVMRMRYLEPVIYPRGLLNSTTVPVESSLPLTASLWQVSLIYTAPLRVLNSSASYRSRSSWATRERAHDIRKKKLAIDLRVHCAMISPAIMIKNGSNL